MKVFLEPTGLFSRAMTRVASALRVGAPDVVEIVKTPEEADLRVVHVIGEGSFSGVATNQPHVIIQYCAKSAGATPSIWAERWRRAELVWSYYDLPTLYSTSMPNFFYRPLGVDPVFCSSLDVVPVRPYGVFTSGYVSGYPAEPIQEVALASSRCRMRTVHLGPRNVAGMLVRPPDWTNVYDVPDEVLRGIYCATRWVSGLRFVEGFELPVIEGLMGGARPFVFDRPETRRWFEDHVVYIPEVQGEELIAELTAVFDDPRPVTMSERAEVARKFDWVPLVNDFWERVLS